MLTWDYWHMRQDLEIQQPFFKIKKPHEIEAHLMQFTVWRYSAKARMLIEWFVNIGFAIYTHIIVARINDAIYGIWEQWTDFVTAENLVIAMAKTDP